MRSSARAMMVMRSASSMYAPVPCTHSVSRYQTRSEIRRPHGGASTSPPMRESSSLKGFASYCSRSFEISSSSSATPSFSGIPSDANRLICSSRFMTDQSTLIPQGRGEHPSPKNDRAEHRHGGQRDTGRPLGQHQLADAEHA